jgi:endonuclease YncB( thermonuclease family)
VANRKAFGPQKGLWSFGKDGRETTRMNWPVSKKVLSLLVLSLALCRTSDAGEIFYGRVVGVSDGDTIKVIDANKLQHKIRLAGIDAPESRQPFGSKAKEALAALVFDRDVELQCGKIDRYGRSVCVVLLDGQDINLRQVEAGFGWWYRKYASEQTGEQRKNYESAETSARTSKRGLWGDPQPISPWVWRRSKRTHQ